MGALIKRRGHLAFFRDGEWRAASPTFEREVRDAFGEWLSQTAGPKVTDPEPDRSAALEVARRIGGRLLAYAAPRRSPVERYLRLRQMSLF